VSFTFAYRACLMYPLVRRIFYQNDPSRISACPVTIHGLLHIADGVEAAGPVWATWAFVMERYCGFVKRRAVRSRAHPYASVDRRILEMAQMNVILLKYGLRKKLTSQRGRGAVIKDKFSECKSYSGPFVRKYH
jgi:hypothetical protein